MSMKWKPLLSHIWTKLKVTENESGEVAIRSRSKSADLKHIVSLRDENRRLFNWKQERAQENEGTLIAVLARVWRNRFALSQLREEVCSVDFSKLKETSRNGFQVHYYVQFMAERIYTAKRPDVHFRNKNMFKKMKKCASHSAQGFRGIDSLSFNCRRSYDLWNSRNW